jgi:hypothetical protein
MSDKKTLNITPTWSQLLPEFIAMLESPSQQSREIGEKNLKKIAELADAYVEHVGSLPPSDKHSQIIEMDALVDVDESDDNLAFTGRVVGMSKLPNYITVEDMEGNAFDIPPTECEVRN